MAPFLTAYFAVTGSQGADSAPGIVAVKPDTGTAIETSQGYMVPYMATIPGTEVTFEMVPVPGGEITIQLPLDSANGEANGVTQLRVIIPPFWIGKHEVTWAEFQQFMNLCDVFEKLDDQGLRRINDENQLDAVTGPSKLYDPSFTFVSGEDPRLPAVSMSQYAAKQYTKWLSLLSDKFYRLPSDAEWEYACRAGEDSAYCFGDDDAMLDDYAWHWNNSDETSHPVGEKLPNRWGIHDMHGNACEWVLDAYTASQEDLPPDGSNSEQAIVWPRELYPRVLRGGSWQLDPVDCRSDARRASDDDSWRSYDPNSPQSPWWFASEEAQDVGFRIIRPLVAPLRTQRNKYWDADLDLIERVVDIRIDKEGKGRRGIVDPELPSIIEQLNVEQGTTQP